MKLSNAIKTLSKYGTVMSDDIHGHYTIELNGRIIVVTKNGGEDQVATIAIKRTCEDYYSNFFPTLAKAIKFAQ